MAKTQSKSECKEKLNPNQHSTLRTAHTCVRRGLSLCTTVIHNTEQNSSDKLPSYPVQRLIYSKPLGRGQHLYDDDADWGVLDWGAYWRHLVNKIEPPMCGSDAALCKLF